MTTATRINGSHVAAEAMGYAALGWRVMPVAPRAKNPLISAWQENASSDEEQIAAWFEQWPDANVGVQLGEKSGIIDLEADSPEAESELLKLFDNDVPVCPTYQSTRGKHRLFKWQAGLPGGAATHIGAIELRTGNGNRGAQSVFPPSIHATGNQYKWLVHPDDVPPPELPDYVLAKIVNYDELGAKPNGNGKKSPEHWDDVFAGSPDGKRNDAIKSLIGRLLRQCKDVNDRDEVKFAWQAATAVNDKNNPPLDSETMKTMFRNILYLERRRRTGESAEPSKDEDKPQKKTEVVFRRISCRELNESNYDLEYLIDNTLVAGQPCIIAGGKKCLKTSLILDMGISLAMGGCFLGKLRVNRAVRVGVMTGESGLATIQETCRRICHTAGYNLSDIGGLVFSEDLPRFGNLDHEGALKRFIMDDELEVVVIDPAYLCLPGADAGNLFQQGELLRGMSQVCDETGCMMILAHHTRKTKTDPFAAPELEDIAWAGFQEFARQWLLVGRREPYEPGTGEHRLWLSAGGSAGHTALWALDINEGTRASISGRFWDVNMMAASDARDDVERRKEQTKQQQIDKRIEEDGRRIIDALVKYPGGETDKTVRDTAGMSGTRFTAALAMLLRGGHVVECEVSKPNRSKPYSGHKLVE